MTRLEDLRFSEPRDARCVICSAPIVAFGDCNGDVCRHREQGSAFDRDIFDAIRSELSRWARVRVWRERHQRTGGIVFCATWDDERMIDGGDAYEPALVLLLSEVRASNTRRPK